MNESARHISIETLYAYETGSLAASQKSRVEEHVAGCTVCKQELELLKNFNTVAKDAEIAERSGAMRAAFGERIKRMDQPPASVPTRGGRDGQDRRGGSGRRDSRGGRVWAGGLMAAAAVLLVFGVVQLSPERENPVPGGALRGESSAVDASVSPVDARENTWEISWESPASGEAAGADVRAEIQILDTAGRVLQAYSADTSPFRFSLEPGITTQLTFARVVLTTPAGSHRQSSLLPLRR